MIKPLLCTALLLVAGAGTALHAQEAELFSRTYAHIHDTTVKKFNKVLYWEAEDAILVMADGRRFYKLDMSGNIIAEHHLPITNSDADVIIHEESVHIISNYFKWTSAEGVEKGVDMRHLNADLGIVDAQLNDNPLNDYSALLDFKRMPAGGFQVLMRYIHPATTSVTYGPLQHYPGSRASTNHYAYLEFNHEGVLMSELILDGDYLSYNLNAAHITDTTIYTVGFHYPHHDADGLDYLSESRRYIMDLSSTGLPTSSFHSPQYFPYNLRPLSSHQFLSSGYDVQVVTPTLRSRARLMAYDEELNTDFDIRNIGHIAGQSRLYNSFYNAEKIYAVGKLDMEADEPIPHQLYITDREGAFVKVQAMNHSTLTHNGEIFSGLQLPDGRCVLVGQIYDLSLSQSIAWLLFTNDEGCINSDCTYPLPTSSMETTHNSTDFNVYPNPSTTGVYHVQTLTTHSAPISLSVYTISGQQIHSSTHSMQNSDITIDIHAQPAGVYILQVQSGQRSGTYSLIKQ